MPSRPNPGPDPIEHSMEVLITKTNQPKLCRADPEPDPNPHPKGKSPRSKIESRRQPKHSANTVSLLDKECPKNFHQAIKSDLHQHWEDAIQKELYNMEKHQALTEDTQLLSATWVFKRKTNEDGNLTKFKA
ncbi:hypothetical protein O181_037256 [Austropuccinia psidii MF-1]|uniref:Reverse transcriptase Ty1/copia-type domain-containing protein n=1 Tax=Austropuccinia psidii MF-1 TaxID=1389203 RepID=A0A9Q3DBR2_9BASI|nr:hypothetical protein [Austropuccinia psidii MF-1]